MTTPSTCITDIKNILAGARQNAYRAVQSEMVSAYWRIGERIVQEEQHGAARAQYGKGIIKTLSAELTRESGRGFGERSLREIRQFYLYFQNIEIQRMPFANLGWSHFQRVLNPCCTKIRSCLPANTCNICRVKKNWCTKLSSSVCC